MTAPATSRPSARMASAGNGGVSKARCGKRGTTWASDAATSRSRSTPCTEAASGQTRSTTASSLEAAQLGAVPEVVEHLPLGGRAGGQAVEQDGYRGVDGLEQIADLVAEQAGDDLRRVSAVGSPRGPSEDWLSSVVSRPRGRRKRRIARVLAIPRPRGYDTLHSPATGRGDMHSDRSRHETRLTLVYALLLGVMTVGYRLVAPTNSWGRTRTSPGTSCRSVRWRCSSARACRRCGRGSSRSARWSSPTSCSSRPTPRRGPPRSPGTPRRSSTRASCCTRPSAGW